MFTFILIVQTLVAIVMITVILMQRSEGGGLTGGSPSGLMTARGASDFLTRTTAISATIFVILSIVLAALAAGTRGPREIDPSLATPAPAPAGSPTERQSSPFTPNPQAVPGAQPGTPAAAPATPAAPAQGNQSGVPIAQ
ncbi:preprotein translocase subunit SecG [Sphingosinicella terrae]|jgi:preprotein translocase subunit SecG|uniref:preprotein translocase subunit SecG n=1 Tax=Sphingosinicella terrae TaxID=2172047 RepID=UPI000E0E00B5|nr:preprotein translocase subunit SecG [Sphingosinicella terrae]